MRLFIIDESEVDLTFHAGLGLIGVALNERADMALEAEAVSPLRNDAMPHASMLCSYVALLSLVNGDFEAITGLREDAYIAEALGPEQIPSVGIRRQCMDAYALDYMRIVEDAVIAFLCRSDARFTPLDNCLMPLDWDVAPLGNSHSKMEGGSRNYKGEDGHALMDAHLGREGYCLDMVLRAGSRHCQKGATELLQCVLECARQLTGASARLRLDSSMACLSRMPRHGNAPSAEVSAM